MAFFRTFAAATLAAALGVAGTSAFALADPPPWAHGQGHGHSRNRQDSGGDQQGNPKSHATVTGTIAGIDYGSASILIDTPRGMVPIAVTPTTSIFHGSTFASFSDLGRGARVSVDVTEIDGRLIAQIIRIR
jgi:hypothetical protein